MKKKIVNKKKNKEVTLATTDLSNDVEIKKAIKNIQEFKDAFKDVLLEESITLKNNYNTFVTVVTNGDVITVEGKIKSGSKERNFTFTVKVKEKTDLDQLKVDNTVTTIDDNKTVLNFTSDIIMKDKGTNDENTFQFKTAKKDYTSTVQTRDKIVTVNSYQTKNDDPIAPLQSESERTINEIKPKVNDIDNLKVKMDLTTADTVEVIKEFEKTNKFNPIIDNENIALVENLTLIKDGDGNIKFENNDKITDTVTAYLLEIIQYIEKSAIQTIFQFPIKLMAIYQNVLDDAKTSLNNIKADHEVIMVLDGTTEKKVSEQIKKQITAFKNIVNNNIWLEGNLKLIKKDGSEPDFENK